MYLNYEILWLQAHLQDLAVENMEGCGILVSINLSTYDKVAEEW
jgi:hypothetical protein